MAVRVRLTRVGSNKNPVWRVVVADQRSPRDGRFIETVGHYNPRTAPSTIVLDRERLEHWLARGAQPSGTVKQLMKAHAKTAATTAAAAQPEPAAPAAETPSEADSPSEAESPAPPETEPASFEQGESPASADGGPAAPAEGDAPVSDEADSS
jgi:small subunit ribosomal protein S16